jgi:predicted dehydrogenase
MSDCIQVGLIGFGMAGQVFHAPIITSISGLQLSIIRETKADNITLAKSRYPSTIIVKNSAEIITNPAIELVVIATPNAYHYPLAKQVLSSGKHVVVDKPFTITSREAGDLINLAKKEKKLISVFHNRRWDSDFKTIQKILQEKTLGHVREVEIHFDRFRPKLKKDAWREDDIPGSGILYDLGSHLIDQALVLFGSPVSIFADIQLQRQGAKVDDYFRLVLQYDNLKVILQAGMLAKEPGPHFTLLGDKGSFVKYGFDVQEEALKAGYKPNEIPNWGEEPEYLWGKLSLDSDNTISQSKLKSEKGDYRDYYKNVYQSILGKSKLSVKPEQARDVICLIESAQQSTREGQTIILD